MTRDGAEQIRNLVLECTGRLNECARVGVEVCTNPEELRWLKRRIGEGMEILFDRILRPILEEHPDLKPKDWPD